MKTTTDFMDLTDYSGYRRDYLGLNNAQPEPVKSEKSVVKNFKNLNN